VHARLDDLVIALYVTIDELLEPRRGPGRPPKLADSELVCLAVAQVLLGYDSERRWLRAVHRRLGHLFPYVCGQAAYNRRLRRAAPLVAQLRRAVQRSRSRGRLAMVILDNLGIHTPKGSRLLRELLTELGEQLVLVYTPTYDPDANRIEWLWRALRRSVTHTHRRQALVDLVADADRWARTITPAQVLSQIGSPFALDQQLPAGEELDHAA